MTHSVSSIIAIIPTHTRLSEHDHDVWRLALIWVCIIYVAWKLVGCKWCMWLWKFHCDTKGGQKTYDLDWYLFIESILTQKGRKLFDKILWGLFMVVTVRSWLALIEMGWLRLFIGDDWLYMMFAYSKCWSLTRIYYDWYVISSSFMSSNA